MIGSDETARARLRELEKENTALKRHNRLLEKKLATHSPPALNCDILTCSQRSRSKPQGSSSGCGKTCSLLLDHLLNGLAYCRLHLDEHGHPADVSYLLVNPAFEQFTGIQDPVGKRASEIVPGIWDTNPELLQAYGRVALSGNSERLEAFIPQLQEWFSISVYSPQAEHFVAIFEIISGQKRREEECRQLRLQLEQKVADRTADVRQSNEFLAFVLDGISAFVCFCDSELRFVFLNELLAEWIGLPREEIIGRHLSEILEKQNYENVLPHAREALSGKRASFELKALNREGKEQTFFLCISPAFRKGTVKGIFAFIIDMTDHKRAEAERDQFCNFFNYSSDLMCIADDNFHFLQVNQTFCQTLGYSQQELTSRPFLDFVHPDDLPTVIAHREEVFTPEGILNFEHRFLTRDGSIVWISWAAKPSPVDPTLAYCIARNITALKKLETSLRESHILLESAARIAHLGTWKGLLSDDSNIWSEEQYRILGVPRDTPPTAQAFLNAVHPQDREKVRAAAELALAGIRPFETECRVVWPNGEIRHLFCQGEILESDRGKKTSMIGTTLDITETKRVERQLQELNDSLGERVVAGVAESQHLTRRLRSLALEITKAEQKERKRVAMILHDHLQQLLVSAKMHAALVGKDRSKGVKSAAKEITSLLNEALSVTRSLTIDLFPPILHQSGLPEALAWLAKRMEQKYRFSVEARIDPLLNPPSPEIRGFLFEAARELLHNSWKHSGCQQAALTFEASGGNDCWLIIEDKGKGFSPPADHLGATDGLGLFSLQQRLLNLGGNLEIKSSSGSGTRAVLSVPLSLTSTPGTPPSLEVEHG